MEEIDKFNKDLIDIVNNKEKVDDFQTFMNKTIQYLTTKYKWLERRMINPLLDAVEQEVDKWN